MSVGGGVRGGRSRKADGPADARPDGAPGPRRDAARDPGPQRGPAGPALRPVVVAVVVLLLWGAWLLLPDTSRGELTGSGPTVAGESDQGRDLMSAATGGDVADQVAPGAVEPSAGAEDAVTAEEQAAHEQAARTWTAREQAARERAEQRAAAAEQVPPVAAPVQVPQRGEGTFTVAPGSGPRTGDGTLVRYSVEVEDGVPVDPVEVATVVDGVLADPRSWTAQGEWSLQRTDTDPDVRFVITSPDTTDVLCAPLRTGGQYSCQRGNNLVLNALRWTEGATSWGDDLVGYRQYLVNHELGHRLSHLHVDCPGAGQPAPVMLQQTKGLQGCTPNAWPYP